MEDNLKIVSVYDEENYKTVERNIVDYLNRDTTFKYVLFRGIGGQELHFLRLSPLREFEGKLIGDTHLTIVGKLIDEFKEKRNLSINEIDFRQDSGHGLLWLINEKEKENPLTVCAEAGAFMKIENEDIYFNGESQALKGGKVYGINKTENLLIRLKDGFYDPDIIKGREKYIVNPIYSIPANIIKEELKNEQSRIYVPNKENERVRLKEVIENAKIIRENVERKFDLKKL